MKTLYNVTILDFSTINELPDAWDDKKFIDILDVLEYGDTSEIIQSEIKDMCLMALTDNEPDEAANILLDYVFAERLTKGQKDNLSHEMQDEKIWEEYADLSMHEEFFNVTQLLYQAYNGKFPYPEAVKFQVKITVKNTHELDLFSSDTEANLLRLIVKGMPENTLLNRLFKDEINGDTFPEAKDIIWQLKTIANDSISITFEAISSEYWFNDLKFVSSVDVEHKVMN